MRRILYARASSAGLRTEWRAFASVVSPRLTNKTNKARVHTGIVDSPSQEDLRRLRRSIYEHREQPQPSKQPQQIRQHATTKMGDANQQQVEVLLYGLGAIGAFYAFILSRNPRVRLSVCARSNYEVVKAQGMTINSDNHGGPFTFHPHKVLRTPAEAQQTYDYIICCNKAVNMTEVLEQLKPAVDEERTTFALMQNGVGNEVLPRQQYPNSTIIGGVLWVGAHQPRPGYVEHRSSELTEAGLHPRIPNAPSATENQRLQTLVQLFTDGGTNFDIPEHIQTAKWKKAIWNMAWNSITALTGCNTEFWLDSSFVSTPVTRSLMLEAIAVARAVGVPGIEESLADELIAKVKTLGKLYSSMYWDFKAGAPMEIEVILGHCVREGHRLGVPTPTLNCLYGLLAAAEGRMKIDREGGERSAVDVK